jgi:hypothetical protein
MTDANAADHAAAAALQAAQATAAARLPELGAALWNPDGSPTGPAARIAFWRAFFELPAWLFIARGATGNPQPFAVMHPNGPTLLAFGSAEGAKATGVAAGLSEQEASLILAVPMPQAVDFAFSHAASGVQFLQVEAQLAGGLVIPLQHLPAMRHDLLGPPTDG